MTIKRTLLALLALLALDVARADSYLKPAIVAIVPNALSYRGYDDKIHLDTNFGEDITVLCTADNAANLNIENGQVEPYNSTTIQMSIKKPDVGVHTYYCTDSIENETLVVTVIPLVTVTAPNVRQTRYSHRTLFFVPRENYDVFCSADNSVSLSLTLFSEYEELQTEVVNATTVSSTNNTEERSYLCQKNAMTKFFDVIVDFKPEAQELQCVLYLNHKLECTWKSSSTRNTFMLSSKGKLLCTDMSGGMTGSCERAWDEELEDTYVYREEFPLQLQTCNRVYCNEQTFSINIKSMIKLEPVYNLQMKYTKTESTVAWRHRNLLCYRGCEFKVDYRLIGMQWRKANVSSLGCYDFSSGLWCKLHLPLPCQARYEIRVYVRPLTAIEDRFWSEPASVSYVTPLRSVDNDSCEEFRRQEPIPTASTVLHEVRELIRELKLIENNKLTEIKALLDTQT